jgi:hypothetical protein
MKFYGNGIVWDSSKNKILCKFIKGEFETIDPEIKEKLIDLGYTHDEEIEITSYGDVEPKFIDGIKELTHEEEIEANTKEYEDFLGGENPFKENIEEEVKKIKEKVIKPKPKAKKKAVKK